MKPSTQHSDLFTVAARLPIAALAVFISCLFSLIVILQHPLLNDDAFKYLRAAEIFSTDGARAVLESFGWYHYSFLIALVDKVMPGGLIVAAHMLNIAFYALLTYAFLLLVRELRDTPRVQFFAAVCILLFPLTNEMRFFLIRDAGFWAFGLLSLVFLIRYNRTGAMRMAFWWSIALVAASAFRLEGLLLLTLAPWSLLLPDASRPLRERAERCGRLVGILAAVVVSVMLAARLAGLRLPDLIAYTYRWYLPLLGNLGELSQGTAANVGAALFTPDNFPGSDNTALTLLIAFFGYGLALVMSIVDALKVPVVILLLAGPCLRLPIAVPAQAKHATQAYVAVSALALLLFMLIMHFTTGRYATLLALLLLTQAPLIVDELYTRAQASQRLRKYFHVAFSIVCVGLLIDGLHSFGYSHRHIQDSTLWALAELPAGARIKTNNIAIAYGSGRVTDYETTVRDPALVIANSQAGDYLFLEMDADADLSALTSNPAFEQLRRFVNERGDQVLVYRHR